MNEPVIALCVLVVDDDKSVLSAFRRLLSIPEYGCTVVTMQDPFAALEYLWEHPVDLVISDTNLDCSMWGPEFLHWVSRIRPSTARIIMSAGDSLKAQEAIDNGVAFAFLPKPWNPSELTALLAEALRISSGG